MNDDKKKRMKDAMMKVRVVQAILRRWDPIGVEPGKMAPSDEYDSYAHHIVSLVAHGCSVDDLARHLQVIRTDSIGLEADSKQDAEIAKEIMNTLRGGAL